MNQEQINMLSNINEDYKLSPEDRKLLAKDLYQRLGTNTLVQDMKYIKTNRPVPIWLVDTLMEEVRLFADEPWIPIDTVRPYLRSMSSMTEEEKTEYFLLKHRDNNRDDNIILLDEASVLIDWLVDNKFDYRGLIPKGLALEAKEGMYENE